MVDLNVFRKYGKVKIFKPNEVVLMENDIGDTMYIPIKGTFGVYISSFTDFPTRIAEITAGQFFGEMAMIDKSPRSATIISEATGLAVIIENDKFAFLIEENPDIAVKITKTLSSRAEFTAGLVRATGKTVPELPPNLLDPQPLDCSFDNMQFLAGRVRELNAILGGDQESLIEIKQNAEGLITLLPDGHPRFDRKNTTGAEEMLTDAHYVCPYCGSAHFGKVPLFSKLKEVSRTNDERVIYENFDILLYTNVICPNCNYCDIFSEFTKERKASPNITIIGNQFKNIENFTGFADFTAPTLDEAILSHHLQLLCLKQTQSPGPQLRIAKTWHRLYWLYSDMGSAGLMEYAARDAVEYYREHMALNDADMSTADYMMINILMAELCIFLKNYEEAKSYLVANTTVSYAREELLRKSMQRISHIKNMI